MKLILGADGSWRKETKEEVMEVSDIEGKFPCNLCWEDARDNGIYVFPIKGGRILPRCVCGRVISGKKQNE